MPRPGRTRLAESADLLIAFLVDVGDEQATAEWRRWRDELRAADDRR